MPRRRRADKYSYDARKVLPWVWAASGGQCGKYLAVSMELLLDSLEARSELVDGVDRYSQSVRAELLSMSAATLDRYLKPVRDRDRLRGISTTKPRSRPRTATSSANTGLKVRFPRSASVH